MRFANLISTAFAMLASSVLMAPVQAGAPDAEWRQVAYQCETGQPLTVSFRAIGSAVKVVPVADQKAVTLVLRPAKTGFRYSDSRYELRGEGEAITWKVGSRAAVSCTTADPAAENLAAAATR